MSSVVAALLRGERAGAGMLSAPWRSLLAGIFAIEPLGASSSVSSGIFMSVSPGMVSNVSAGISSSVSDAVLRGVRSIAIVIPFPLAAPLRGGAFKAAL